jgi:nucleoside-diphosphate-sugar epimerase
MGKVLVTGAYGFIGAAYCAHLAARKIPYVGAVRARRADESRPEIVEVGDFADADWTEPLVAEPVDCIIHLAARAHRMKDDAPDPRAAYRRQNVEVTNDLLEAALAAQVRRLVFASSVKVHGEATAPGVILRESDPVAPQDDYARSKAEAEAWVREFGQEHAIETVILRLPLVYGPGVKANFAVLVDAVRERRVLPLGAIINQRSLLGVTNLCAAIDAARTHPLAAGETFFVADGEDVSTPELVRAIGVALAVRPRLWRCPLQLLLLLATLALRRAAARRLLESFAIDSAKIRRTLGWTPPLTLADELQCVAQALRRARS